MRRAPIALALLAPLTLSARPVPRTDAEGNPAALAARRWRQSHEREILEEYIGFLRIPNVSRDRSNIRRNAEYVLASMARRGIVARLLEESDAAPVVFGEITGNTAGNTTGHDTADLAAPGAAHTHTYVFYAHYDGQPVDPREWAAPPFEPVLRTARIDQGGDVVPFPAAGGPVDPAWRIYARSASDDKAQIFALLAAVDALRSAGLKPRASIKFVFEGEEEIGSPNLHRVLRAHRDLLKGDLWLICDGPEHPSGRQTVTFGARGIQSLEITVYGPKRELHSGHYGNWAPNPAMMLSRLLASMKDANGGVTIARFYEGVVPLSDAEKQAIVDAPNEDASLERDLWLGRTEGGGKRLAELINLPSLNIRGLASAHVGEQAANVIPASATASIDLRLVKGIGHEAQAARVIEHIRRQGYYVTADEPDERTRLAHPRIARVVVDPSGYDAVRTSMDLPVAQQVIRTAGAVRSPVVLERTSGGSVPLVVIESILGSPTISIPIVNHDNSQHSSNENLRISNLWNGIETQAALLMMP